MPKIVIDEARCKGCALCTIACPRQLIALSDKINKQGFLPAVITAENLQKCTSLRAVRADVPGRGDCRLA